MNLGLFMMPLHPPSRILSESYDEDLEVIRHADRLGLNEVWIGEHMLLPWENMPTPELFIARALGDTDQIVFGTGVVLLHEHNPVHVAHRIAMLDHLAKGRLMFGIGSGGSPSDTEILGIPGEPAIQRERMTEAIDLILRLWKEGPFDYDGVHYRMQKPKDRSEMEVAFHMRPYQNPHPPIAVAGTSARSSTLELAGERGWIPLSASLVHVSQLATNWESVEEGAKRTGQKPDKGKWRLARQVYVAETTEKAREEALSGALARDFKDYWSKLFGNRPGGRGMDNFKFDTTISDEDVTPQYLLDNYWIVGDPDHCIQEIKNLHEQSGGFDTLLLQTEDWGNGNRQFHNSLDLLGKEVLPVIKNL